MLSPGWSCQIRRASTSASRRRSSSRTGRQLRHTGSSSTAGHQLKTQTYTPSLTHTPLGKHLLAYKAEGVRQSVLPFRVGVRAQLRAPGYPPKRRSPILSGNGCLPQRLNYFDKCSGFFSFSSKTTIMIISVPYSMLSSTQPPPPLSCPRSQHLYCPFYSTPLIFLSRDPLLQHYLDPLSVTSILFVLARPLSLPVAGAHVTPPEGGRWLAVTVTVASQRRVAVDRDRPIAMLDFSALTRPYNPPITVNHAVSQGAGRESCPRQGSLSVSRSHRLPRGPDLCAAYGPQVPWDDPSLARLCTTFSLFKVGSVET
jgi:hypothetical protein